MTRDELELLTPGDLADLWRVSKRTINRRIAAGLIPTVSVGGHRRIRAIDAARLASAGVPTMLRSTTSTERGSR